VPVSPLPALQNGYVTFGCFQVLTKMNDAVLALWGRVLQAVPHSRLRLASNQSNDAVLKQRMRQRLEAAGIDTARVKLVGPVPREQYLSSYAEVDIVLDTFPFTGGTTSCEALWMGVPTLTMTGSTLIARQGASMMGCVGLTDWIAVDEADYLNKAVRHAADPHALHVLRQSLRKRTLASPLFDAERFAGHLEQAFFDMWRQKYPSVKLLA
jgi:protein O-GlcNAc transferase